MKSKLFVLIAAFTLTGSAALAQPRGPENNGAPVPDAFSSYSRPIDRQCFNGKFLSGVNRVGDRVLLLQSARSDVFRVELPQPCAAIDGARKLTVRSAGSYKVCNGNRAEVVALTPTGVKRCSIGEVRALTSREVAALTKTPHR